MIITNHAYARAGLIGNPSDGYFGKTISCMVRNFSASVRIWESPSFEIVPAAGDLGRFDSVTDFLYDLKLHGYYGGMRLIKAAIKRFNAWCVDHDIELKHRNYTIDYDSNIPRLVGLSGSSAIVVAALRALMQFYGVIIPRENLPSLALACETEELGINAGLQDRVIQAYEGMVYMDFDKHHIEEHGHGIYEPISLTQIPPLYIAYDPQRAEVSDVAHRNLRQLYNQGDPTVHAAMQKFRDLTDQAREALHSCAWERLGKIMDENFETRRTIMNIAPENLRMIEVARSTGASAKFCGSGGAIVGIYRDGRHYQEIVDAMATLRCSVLRPIIYDDQVLRPANGVSTNGAGA